jgi:hypothetical protein
LIGCRLPFLYSIQIAAATFHIEKIFKSASKAIAETRGIAAVVLMTSKMVAFDLLGAFFRHLTKRIMSDTVGAG